MKFWVILAATFALSACAVQSDIKGADLHEAARLNAQMGIDYYSKGELDLALDKLQRAVEQDPSLVVAHSSLALVYARRGNNQAAEKEYRKALSLDSANGNAENNFGVFLCAQGRLAEAEKHFRGALLDKQYSTPAAAMTNAGVCLRNTDPDKAERYFRAALESNSEFPDALANLAYLTWKKQDYWRARAFLQRYELVAQPTAETLWIGAQTERKLGDLAAAAQYENRLKREFPQSSEALKPLDQ